MVVRLLPKQDTRVRFSSPAPISDHPARGARQRGHAQPGQLCARADRFSERPTGRALAWILCARDSRGSRPWRFGSMTVRRCAPGLPTMDDRVGHAGSPHFPLPPGPAVLRRGSRGADLRGITLVVACGERLADLHDPWHERRGPTRAGLPAMTSSAGTAETMSSSGAAATTCCSAGRATTPCLAVPATMS